MKRDWRMYNKDILIEKLLRNHDTTLQPNNVQCAWNYFENLMINVIDEILPLSPFSNDEIKKKEHSPLLKTLLNRKKRLLKSKRITDNLATNDRLKLVNSEIRKI